MATFQCACSALQGYVFSIYGVLKLKVLDHASGMPSPWIRGRTRQ